jgi:hypothetical protein
MSSTSLDFLWSPASPWVHVGTGEGARKAWVPSHFYARLGISVCVRRLRGWKMRNTSGLMSEIGAALQLFDGFGENWYALEEALCYLDEWLPAEAYVIVVEKAEELLLSDDEELRALLRTFSSAGEFWSRPVDGPDHFRRGPAPFHLLLNVSEDHLEAISRITAAAHAAGVPVGTDPAAT